MPPTEGGEEWSGNNQHIIEPVNMREIQLTFCTQLFKSVGLLRLLRKVSKDALN